MMKKHFLSGGLFVAAVLLAASAVLFPAVSFVSVFAASLVCSFAVITSSNPWFIGIGSFAAFVIAWIVSGSASAALLFLILFLPVGAALGLGFNRKWGFNDVMSFAALNGTILGVIALIVFIGEFSGGSFDVKSVIEPVLQNFKELLHSAFAVDDPSVNAFYEDMGVSLEQNINIIYLSVVYNIPTFYICFILLIAVLCYWLIKAFYKRTPEPIDFMGRFDGCRISRTGAIIYSVSTLLYLFSSNTVFGIIVSNFSNVMTYVFAYAGISLISFLLDFKNVSSFIKTGVMIASVAVCLLPMGLLNIIALLGFFDSCWNIRERLQNSGF